MKDSFAVGQDLQSCPIEYQDFQSAFKHDYATSFAAEVNIIVFESKLPLWQKTYCIGCWRIKNPHIPVAADCKSAATGIYTFQMSDTSFIEQIYVHEQFIK